MNVSVHPGMKMSMNNVQNVPQVNFHNMDLALLAYLENIVQVTHLLHAQYATGVSIQTFSDRKHVFHAPRVNIPIHRHVLIQGLKTQDLVARTLLAGSLDALIMKKIASLVPRTHIAAGDVILAINALTANNQIPNRAPANNATWENIQVR